MKISIITATYNRADTIRDTIESILNQTYQDWEHIVVDGVSKDNTLAILGEYKDRYKGRLKLLSEPDKGIYDAMNKGIAMATGDVVGILNSDDFYTDSKVLKIINDTLKDSDLEGLHADVATVNPLDLTKTVRFSSGKGFKPWMTAFSFMPNHPSLYLRRSVYDKFGYFNPNYVICADFDFVVRTIYLGKIRIIYVPKTLITMRDGGVSQNGLESHKIIAREEVAILKNYGVRFPFPRILYRMAYKLIRKIFGMNY